MYIELIIIVAWFLGGFVSGLSGMGAALISLPILVLFIPISMLVPSTTLIAASIALFLTIKYRKSCIYSVIPILTLACIPGILAGVYILIIVPEYILLFCLGLMLICYSAWQYFNQSTKQHKETLLAKCLAGFFTGLASSSLAIGGPPMIVYAIYMKWDQKNTIGTMGVFFLISSVITMIAQFSAGMYTSQVITYALYGIPSAIIGALSAGPFLKYITMSRFKLLLLGILILAGITSIGRAISIM